MTTEQKITRIFENHVTKQENGCLLFSGMKINGYGFFSVDGIYVPIHKILWERRNGSIPEHKNLVNQRKVCGNRNCINIEHWGLAKPRTKQKPVEMVEVTTRMVIRDRKQGLWDKVNNAPGRTITMTKAEYDVISCDPEVNMNDLAPAPEDEY